MRRSTLVLAVLALGLAAACGRDAPSPTTGASGTSSIRHNVLFIAVDDLRPELGAFGVAGMITPNVDRLAAEGRAFQRHYVQAPTCGASRYALLTGVRPTSGAHLSNEAFVRLLPADEEDRPESFAHLFRRNGYHTVSIGKISHYPGGRIFSYEGTGDGRPEMPFSWDEHTSPIDKWGTAWNAFFGYADGTNRNQNRGVAPAFEMADVPDAAYPDGQIADAAVATLGELRDRPFLLAVGFMKPHLPFTAPKRYWDLYDREALQLSPNPEAPIGVDPRALHPSNELFGSYGHPVARGGAGVRLDDEYARTLRHGYYAAVSYVDAQIGKVLDALDRLGLADSTVVVLWGDHGWHLGDHTIWGKHTTFERALQSPLIIRVPGMAAPGVPTDGIVETLDLYPTLAELNGLRGPDDLTGVGLVPLLDDPSHPGKDGAFGYWSGRRSLRTERYRLTRYDDGEPVFELFDHETDPNETTNVAAAFPEIVARLAIQLDANAPSLVPAASGR